MSASAFRTPDQPQRSLFERQTPEQRLRLAEKAYIMDEDERRQYTDRLNQLSFGQLLHEERVYLSRVQPLDHDGDDDASIISTTLTNMNLEDGVNQRPSHLTKIVNGYNQHNASPPQPLPRPHRTARGSRGGKGRRGTPQPPDQHLLLRLRDDFHPVDPSDMTSDAGTTRSPVLGATCEGNNASNAGPTGPTAAAFSPSRVSPYTPAAPERMRHLQTERAAVMEEYKKAVKVLFDIDVRLREIDSDMLRLGTGAGET
ncbi:hypothetical protein LY76DRAFT_649074 [Colletotrichum caudatum]|nr:hypothetical protein LY76DRAFT_649074 [Colletotrichum caudatum]